MSMQVGCVDICIVVLQILIVISSPELHFIPTSFYTQPSNIKIYKCMAE